MASRVSRGIARTIKGPRLANQFASQAAARQSDDSSLVNQPPKLTKLPSGVIVASVENNSPISRVAVAVNAGSRFEDADNLGITHCLRVAAGLTNANSTSFGIARSIQQEGAQLTCTTSREYIYYTVDCIRDNVDSTIKFLRDITTAPAFKKWEVAKLGEKLEIDLAAFYQQHAARSFDLLHQAAFRSTLGRSLYCPEVTLGRISSEQLLNYVQTHYTNGRVAIVGVGIDHDQLVDEANKFNFFPAGPVAAEKATYGGGEIRINTGSGPTAVSVAVEGPSLAAKDLLHAGVLQYVMGSGPFIKYSNDSLVPRLGQAVAQATTEPFSVSCFNANYTDAGLFGFTAISQGTAIEKVLKSAFSQFASVTKGGITDKEVARAKKQLKASLYFYLESGDNLLTDLAEQALGHQQIVNPEEIAKQIDAITTNDVVNVAKRIINSRPSMAVVGDTARTPYIDDLYR
ncbi:cytochrome b-c1 complex subunit 2, mitochondrial isoform X2 [Patella vulgata]|uniref:cytochrome b-c1 complex subunit 2, mitochondrial isoform X2 n=1 Tax=Patella vulgata TaxID=6465 RepID=UPI0024A90348|nr:cytochrome b-c1 complex subunit 2, mitochondrial isoform X2 [Patella vulgata]